MELGEKWLNAIRQVLRQEMKTDHQLQKFYKIELTFTTTYKKTNSEFKLEDRVYRGQVVGTKATLKIPKLIDIKPV